MNKTELPKTSAPAGRALAAMGVTSIEDLSQFTEEDFLSWHGIGPKVARIIRQSMKENNITFK